VLQNSSVPPMSTRLSDVFVWDMIFLVRRIVTVGAVLGAAEFVGATCIFAILLEVLRGDRSGG
jgi:hypothetical protein